MCLYVYRVYTTCIDHSPYVRLYVSGMYTTCIDHAPYVCLYVSGMYTTCIDHSPYVCLYVSRVYSTRILRSVASSTYGRNFQDGRQVMDVIGKRDFLFCPKSISDITTVEPN